MCIYCCKLFCEDFWLDEKELAGVFNQFCLFWMLIKNFLIKNLCKYCFCDFIIFDGWWDVFFCECFGGCFDCYNIIDL